MNENLIVDWIQLINTEGVGPVTFYKLLQKYGSAEEALKELGRKQAIFLRKEAAYEFEKAVKNGITLLLRGDKHYPKNIDQLNDAPPVLYIKGRLDILNHPATVSIVGSRNASVNGRKIASKIAYDLTENDVVVVSGMARGIDAAAHKGALYAKDKQGPTIAVLGTGVDTPYPSENKDLYNQICEQGTVLSEFLLGTKPQAVNFPKRNRLVSALGAGVLVVEASLNSGSLITAKTALEQGKDIFAVPGSPLEGRSAGSHKLIREGAVLAESADDILETLRFTQNRQIKNFVNHDPAEDDLIAKPLDKQKKSADIATEVTPKSVRQIIEHIPADGIDIDELIRNSGADTNQAMMQITELELEGLIERVNGNTLMLKILK